MMLSAVKRTRKTSFLDHQNELKRSRNLITTSSWMDDESELQSFGIRNSPAIRKSHEFTSWAIKSELICLQFLVCAGFHRAGFLSKRWVHLTTTTCPDMYDDSHASVYLAADETLKGINQQTTECSANFYFQCDSIALHHFCRRFTSRFIEKCRAPNDFRLKLSGKIDTYLGLHKFEGREISVFSFWFEDHCWGTLSGSSVHKQEVTHFGCFMQ